MTTYSTDPSTEYHVHAVLYLDDHKWEIAFAHLTRAEFEELMSDIHVRVNRKSNANMALMLGEDS